MNIEKAMAALRRGDRVTRKGWKAGTALCIRGDMICHCDLGDPAMFNSSDLFAEDWEIVVELVPFAQVLPALLVGKKAARRPWMDLDRRYIIHSGPVGSQDARVILASEVGGRRSVGPWDAASTDILANDWVILD